jgi:hypothetical protein
LTQHQYTGGHVVASKQMQVFCLFSVLLIEVNAGKQAQLAGTVSTQARANSHEDTLLHWDA